MDERRELLPPAKPVQVLPPEGIANATAGLTRSRKVLALLVAAISDAISVFAQAVLPVEWGVDAITAVLLFAILGFRWPLLPVLVIEAVPGLATFPTWLLAVSVIVGVTPTKSDEKTRGLD